MTSQPRIQTITRHIFINILRSKENEAVNFGQLIEYNFFKHKYKYKYL